jgi:capsular exopolysaccharide synthesis family protein
MSRVFEALTKADLEQKRHIEPVFDAGEAVPPVYVDNGQVQGWQLGSNGKERRDTGSLPAVRDGGGKSWRERMEELFFGWDLRRFSSYPIVALEKESAASEQYKILREQIKRLRTETGIQVVSISSPVKRDGKTTVAVNLSAALALDYEQKVLLIDADLRAPSVHRYFNVKSASGLGEYLSSTHAGDITELVQETFLPGLSVLPAGRPRSLSSELLAKERMGQLMAELRARFPDYQMIIDNPPILSTPDPMVVAKHVDGILLVVRAGKTPRDYLLKALRSINSTKVMGIVFNGADLGMASKYYYYYTDNAH